MLLGFQRSQKNVGRYVINRGFLMQEFHKGSTIYGLEDASGPQILLKLPCY